MHVGCSAWGGPLVGLDRQRCRNVLRNVLAPCSDLLRWRAQAVRCMLAAGCCVQQIVVCSKQTLFVL